MFNENWCPEHLEYLLAQLVESLKGVDGSIVEVGSWEGKSSVVIANAAYPEEIFCIDWWLGNVSETKVTGNKHITESILESRDVETEFKTNMSELTAGNYKILKGDSFEILPTFNERVKFAFLDSSSDYASVKRNIELLLPKMVPGGILCGYNFLNASKGREDLEGGVERAVLELLPKSNQVGNLWIYTLN